MTLKGRSSGNRLRDVPRVHVTGQYFGTWWQTKSYRYNGLKEFIYKHLPMILCSSLQTTPEKVSESSANQHWTSLRTEQTKINQGA
ncbi:hypothetical protein AVEN_81692-1, partial [Araneus ventricosus]